MGTFDAIRQSAFLPEAFALAHRRLAASASRARPAALMPPLRDFVEVAVAPAPPRCLAQRALCAAAIRLRAAMLM